MWRTFVLQLGIFFVIIGIVGLLVSGLGVAILRMGIGVGKAWKSLVNDS